MMETTARELHNPDSVTTSLLDSISLFQHDLHTMSRERRLMSLIKSSDRGGKEKSRQLTAINFIRMVSAVSMTITSPSKWDANGIGAAKLSLVTGRKVAILLV